MTPESFLEIFKALVEAYINAIEAKLPDERAEILRLLTSMAETAEIILSPEE
jgi:hypothetical protein